MIAKVVEPALLITGFVAIMMLVIEYINVLTRGAWQVRLTNRKWSPYIPAVILGALPGCMGAFAVVAMYSHRVISFGALVAAMVATSGDEAFVMLALFPDRALLLTAILAVIGLLTGVLVDRTITDRIEAGSQQCPRLEIHGADACECFPWGQLLAQWRRFSVARLILTLGLTVFIAGVLGAVIGPDIWNWQRFSLLGVGLVGLFIAATVPEHFLQEHLWRHVVLKHIPRIFLWTLGALLITNLITSHLDLEKLIAENTPVIMLIACLVGIIPESGPHLFFVTLFAQGMIPFSVLLASSIVQDGHGMLPLLAHSRRGFLLVKGINLLVGAVIGFLILILGG